MFESRSGTDAVSWTKLPPSGILMSLLYSILANDRLRRRWRLGRFRRDREGQPGIPALSAVLRREFPISLQVEIALHVAERKQVADLRTDAGDARAEAVERSRRSGIVCDLLEVIADQAELHLRSEEVRRGPVDVKVDAVLIPCVFVLEVVGEAGNHRELVAGLRVEIGIATAPVDRAVPDAHIGEAFRVVITDRHIALEIGHHVVGAEVPFQRKLRNDVPI